MHVPITACGIPVAADDRTRAERPGPQVPDRSHVYQLPRWQPTPQLPISYLCHRLAAALLGR